MALAEEVERGVRVVLKEGGSTQTSVVYSKSYALLIGISDYEDAAWPDLESIPSEMEKVREALEAQGFVVTILQNLTARAFRNEVEQFIFQNGADEEARMYFLFSGHGYSSSDGRTGYLVPSDAPNPARLPQRFQTQAIQMSEVKTWCTRMASRHALIMFDSCFSGTIFRSRSLKTGEVPALVSDHLSKPVRHFITSGSAGEKVPAVSAFVPCFIRGLQGEADLTGDGYITGSEMGLFLQNRLKVYSESQTPQEGKLSDLNFDEGEFIFVVPPKPKPSQNYVQPGAGDVDMFELENLDSWEKYQTRMRQRAHEIRSKGFTPAIEIKAWEKFLAAFDQDNPYTIEDDTLRQEIQTHVAGLRKQTVIPQPLPKPVPEVTPAPAKPETPVQAPAPVVVLPQETKQEPPAPVNPFLTPLKPSPEVLPSVKPAPVSPAEGASDVKPPVVRPEEVRRLGSVLNLELAPGVAIQMAYLPATTSEDWKKLSRGKSTFSMGSPLQEHPGRYGADEIPHEVTLTKGFWLSRHEVTQKQWQSVMGNNPSWFKSAGGECPVENISWEDASTFAHRLTQLHRKQGLLSAEQTYRLPTEAEWEYACRAGTSNLFSFGDGEYLHSNQANFGEHQKQTVPVGSYPPNAWGFYDMHGNVNEWCSDWYAPYSLEDTVDPAGPSRGSSRVSRGGSWNYASSRCRSAVRYRFNPESRYNYIGFRLARSE